MSKEIGIKFPGLWKPPEPDSDLEEKVTRKKTVRKVKKEYKVPRVPEPRPEEVVREQYDNQLEDKVNGYLKTDEDTELGEEVHDRLYAGNNTVLFAYGDSIYFASEPGQFKRKATAGRIAKLLSFCENEISPVKKVDVYYFFEGLDEQENTVKCDEISRRLVNIPNHPDDGGEYLREKLRYGGEGARSSERLPAYAVAIGVKVGEDIANKFEDKDYSDGFFYSAKTMWYIERAKILIPPVMAGLIAIIAST